MNTTLLAVGLATVFAGNLLAGETLNLKLVPERGSYLRQEPDEVVVKIDLSAINDGKKERRTPLNLAVVLDRSGSMTGAKLEKAKQAAMQLVDHLRSDDVFSLVTFSDEARVVVAAQHVEDKDRLKDKIESVRADGSTALYAGVESGAEQLDEFRSSKRINRVILLSDGLANVGPSTPRDLRRLGSRLADREISVTTIGVGDDYNEDLMAGLAEASDANYYYVKDTEKLPAIFAKELGELQVVAVRNVRIEITCPEGVTPLGFIGRGERFDGRTAVVKLSQFVPGQDRYLFLRCRVKENQSDVARVSVRYTDERDGGTTRETSGTVRINFTDDRSAAEQSVNRAVYAEKELMLTAVAKDEAMQQADAGNYAAAAKILARQNATLNSAAAGASAAAQSQIRSETTYLNDFSNQMDNGTYDGSVRKAMQEQSYNARNSK
jgi:Ca-activated chloride channel family protein